MPASATTRTIATASTTLDAGCSGWANERKIAALRAEVDELESERAEAAQDYAEVDRNRDSVQARCEAIARLEGFRSWEELDADEARARANSHDDERKRIESGSSRLAEITKAMQLNADQSGVAAVRIEAGRNPYDRGLTDLVGELSTPSEEFRTWWASHNVRLHRT